MNNLIDALERSFTKGRKEQVRNNEIDDYRAKYEEIREYLKRKEEEY